MDLRCIFLRLSSKPDVLVEVLIHWQKDPLQFLNHAVSVSKCLEMFCPNEQLIGPDGPFNGPLATHARGRVEKEDAANCQNCIVVSEGKRPNIESNQFNQPDQLPCACALQGKAECWHYYKPESHCVFLLLTEKEKKMVELL